jgi:hypothetical protein
MVPAGTAHHEYHQRRRDAGDTKPESPRPQRRLSDVIYRALHTDA